MMKVGLDFDNTIVNYDGVFSRIAHDRGLIDSETAEDKNTIRQKVRCLTDGEIQWQQLQAEVYGPSIDLATLTEGVTGFFETCRLNRIEVNIVSHKTQFARRDTFQTDLRKAALAFMDNNRFFVAEGLGLNRRNVFFESTRLEKIERIKYLKCTHFIDDLVETFLEATFPDTVEKILYQPRPAMFSSPEDIKVFSSWKQIRGYLFPETG